MRLTSLRTGFELGALRAEYAKARSTSSIEGVAVGDAMAVLVGLGED